MSVSVARRRWVRVMAFLLMAIPAMVLAETFDVPLKNPMLAGPVDPRGAPTGWALYGGNGVDQTLKVVDVDQGQTALLIADGDQAAEIGVSQSFPLDGEQTYRASVRVRGLPEVAGAGAYLQLRFLPSGHFVQTSLAPRFTDRFHEVSVQGTAPPDTTRGMIYLYTHRDPTPRVLVADVRLVGGLPPLPGPPPPPVPPQYDTVWDLHARIALVHEGRASAAIVAPAATVYQRAATAIQRAIQQRTGVAPPIIGDDDPRAAVPIVGNLIVLGNRSTNRTISALYDRYFCLVDLKYPGAEGHVIRTVHNPFGNGYGVVVVGASDDVGVERGAAALGDVLAQAAAEPGELTLGWTMVTQLGRGVTPPRDLREFETWEASHGYGSVGYFGWCSISKRMAMYYMTGDEHSAREVVRLAFPDAQALREIEEIDGERIENKQDPLAGFYHYNAHLAILFWDLIEESPVFTDDERLRIVNAFARQLNHRRDEGVYRLTEPPRSVGSRHGQWSAISLYCLGRYFQTHYPAPVWAQCQRAGELAFGSLHEHAWIAGESDNLFWYNTGLAPILTYMVLTGDRRPLENGVLGELLRGQEALVSGRTPDWALNYAALDFLHKAAYLTQDGRWLTYRQRTGVNTDVFRLGQSFWPEPTLELALPDDLKGQWTIARLPEPAWAARGSGLPEDQSFYFASYRSAADQTGDFVLLDGFNGASRNPYHTFAILELRLDGQTVLQGYHNQVQTRADGMVEPLVAMDAALRTADVIGPTAIAVGEVPRAAFCNWRRAICQRTGRYALVVDDLEFRTRSQHMRIDTKWQTPGGRWDAAEQVLRIPVARATSGDIGGTSKDAAARAAIELRSCDPQVVAGRDTLTMTWTGAVEPGGHRQAFYLIRPAGPDASPRPACVRIADNAALLAVPQAAADPAAESTAPAAGSAPIAALAVAGEYAQTQAQLAVVAEDHLFGQALRSAGAGQRLVAADAPVDLDWDFATGVIHVVARQPTSIGLRLAAPDALRLDDRPAGGAPDSDLHRVALPAGRHTLRGAAPDVSALAQLGDRLQQLLVEHQARRTPTDVANAPATVDAPAAQPALAELPAVFVTELAEPVVAIIEIPTSDGAILGVAADREVRLLTADGKEIRRLQTEGAIRTLHWWEECQTLLVGCVDEQVVAFDLQGQRRWSFTSEMDPAVWQAAKTYWFKSARGHEGIHGLYTAEFDEGQPRCFVGSACTLEILDRDGKLVRRTPVFWGPCTRFLLVDGPDDSRNLLIAQWPNGNDNLAVVNSRTLAVTTAGYAATPPGHSDVGGWTAQNRTGLFYEDLDGDGQKEVVTGINGAWNRVTVYTAQGRPLYNAQFGPGANNTPRSTLRDMDVADLDNDGKQEIVVGISEGLIVALDHCCEKRWATRLASPPISVRCVRPAAAAAPWIVAACDDGAIIALDGLGAPRRRGQIAGRAMQMMPLQSAAAGRVVIATDRGMVAGFDLPD